MSPEENLSISRRLRAAGIRIPIEEDESPPTQCSKNGLLIRLVPEIASNCAVDLGEYGTFFQCYIRLTSNLSRLFTPTEFRLERSWEDPEFHWLEDPNKVWPPKSLYIVYPERKFRYERSYVLNHYTDVRHTLRRGQSLQGYLLAMGGPMPDDVQHGTTIPSIVCVVDQFDCLFSCPIPLWADRSNRLLRATRKMTRKGRLFDVRDPA
jgi:hypothetical protein